MEKAAFLLTTISFLSTFPFFNFSEFITVFCSRVVYLDKMSNRSSYSNHTASLIHPSLCHSRINTSHAAHLLKIFICCVLYADLLRGMAYIEIATVKSCIPFYSVGMVQLVDKWNLGKALCSWLRNSCGSFYLKRCEISPISKGPQLG